MSKLLELIFQGFMEWAYGLTLECWQYFSQVLIDIFSMDLAYLQDMYQRINMSEMPKYQVACPHCGQNFEVPLDFLLG